MKGRYFTIAGILVSCVFIYVLYTIQRQKQTILNKTAMAKDSIVYIEANGDAPAKEIKLKIQEYKEPILLNKWDWPVGSVACPEWFRAFQAMKDPRKFDSYEEYEKHSTPAWRVSTHVNDTNSFNKWKNLAVSLGEKHDSKVVKIFRSVVLRHSKEEYVFIAMSSEGVSPITQKVEVTFSMAMIKKVGTQYCCADSKDFELIANPEKIEELTDIIRSGKARVNGNVLKVR